MKLIISKETTSAAAVTAHPLFLEAVFIECGLEEPENMCFDHHSPLVESQFALSSAGQIYQELLKRRRFPQTVVMNHVRHLDNLMALYLLSYQGLALHPDTFLLVQVADTLDRIGPSCLAALPQLPLGVLTTAQEQIPFKEWELPADELSDFAMKAVASIRRMVTLPAEVAKYELVYESPDKKFAVVTSEDRLGNTLYDAGYDAYAAYTLNEDGSYKWTLARLSTYVPFDIPAAYDALNHLEPTHNAEWSGRAVIGGSPKPAGTRLSPERVMAVLKACYKDR